MISYHNHRDYWSNKYGCAAISLIYWLHFFEYIPRNGIGGFDGSHILNIQTLCEGLWCWYFSVSPELVSVVLTANPISWRSTISPLKHYVLLRVKTFYTHSFVVFWIDTPEPGILPYRDMDQNKGVQRGTAVSEWIGARACVFSVTNVMVSRFKLRSWPWTHIHNWRQLRAGSPVPGHSGRR